jgi:hypothetical protein
MRSLDEHWIESVEKALTSRSGRVCHGVPRIPRNGTVIGVEQLIKKKADPILPRSAAIDRVSAILHTHEVRGSSPLAPTTP